MIVSGGETAGERWSLNISKASSYGFRVINWLYTFSFLLSFPTLAAKQANIGARCVIVHIECWMIGDYLFVSGGKKRHCEK